MTMPIVGEIFSQLDSAAGNKVLLEIRDGQVTGLTGAELLELIRKARTFLASKKLKKGDRCGLLAPNSIRWVAMDLAAMAEGLIVVPLYSRQAPSELVAMMKDSTPALVCCGEAKLRDGIQQNWNQAPPHFLFDEIFAGVEGIPLDRPQVARRRSGHDHLHFRHLRRSQRRRADCGERRASCWVAPRLDSTR